MATVEKIEFEYSIDRGRTWTKVTPEDNNDGDYNLSLGENELRINKTSKDIIFRFSSINTGADAYQEISDINIIYREKPLR